jgi:hypothetical protein
MGIYGWNFERRIKRGNLLWKIKTYQLLCSDSSNFLDFVGYKKWNQS